LLGLGCPKQAFAKIATPRLTTCKNNKEVVQDLDLKGLYKQTVRKKWQKISGQRLRQNNRPYGYRGLKIFTSLKLRFQDFQRRYFSLLFFIRTMAVRESSWWRQNKRTSDTASSHLEPMFRPLVGSGRGDEDESGHRRHWRSR
jgi:hypothetical protein